MTTVRTRPLVILVMLSLLSLSLIGLHKLGYLSPTERFIVQFITPLQQGLHRIMQGARNVRLGWGNVVVLRQENEQLRAEVQRLRSLIISLKEMENENRILRDQLGFIQTNPAYDLLPAQIIGRAPDIFVQTIVIDKGSRDGVREGKVVVAAGCVEIPGEGEEQRSEERIVVEGLVGRVIETGPNYARVLLITDVSSAVNVVVQGSQVEGLLKGRGSGSMLLQYVRQGEQLVPGAVLLTSGLGATFPRGLAVGVITQVQTKDQAPFQTANVIPLVDLDRLNIVFVIRSFDPIRLGSD